jgi:signal transduction histidine kinase
MSTVLAALIMVPTIAIVSILYARARIRAIRLAAMLVESERMASLGKLVPSVTHDVNTSLGVCLSAATYLADETKTIGARLAEGTLKKSELERHFAVERESADILALNLGKAAKLVAGFKRISVDQATEALEEFDLRDYLDQIVLSLGPKLRKTPHRVEVLCDRGIRMKSYPGALSQILTNLVDNSLTHAFGDGDAGTMRILAESRDNWLVITFSDDGAGMTDYARTRAFTPFFTTKPHKGGTGLGLSISRDLARNALGGSLGLDSVRGKGTIFTLRIPINREEAEKRPDTDVGEERR